MKTLIAVFTICLCSSMAGCGEQETPPQQPLRQQQQQNYRRTPVLWCNYNGYWHVGRWDVYEVCVVVY